MERAADWVFSHMTELAAMEVDQPSEVGPTYHDGPGSKLSRVPVLYVMALNLKSGYNLVLFLHKPFLRIRADGLHQSHGHLNHVRPLRLSHQERWQVDHLQRC